MYRPNLIYQFVAILIATLIPLSSFAKEEWDESAKRRKAEYIYIEATKYSDDNNGQHYSLLNHALNLDPNDTGIGFYKGFYDVYLSKDSTELENGIEFMRRHFVAHPEDYHSSNFYGLFCKKIGLHDESLKVWHTLDSIFPQKTNISLQYAEALTSTADTANILKSIDIYNRIEIAEGRDIGTTQRKAVNYILIGDTISAINEVDSLLATSPQNSEYNVFAGIIYDAIIQDDEKTLDYYNKACQYDPSNGYAFYKRAMFYNEIGDSVAFDREVFNVLKHDELDIEVKTELLTGYIRQLYNDKSQQPRIEELLTILQEQHPHQSGIHELYSAYLAAIKDFPRAAEQLSYVLDIDPSDPNKWGQYILLCNQTEDEAQVTNAITRALHYFPENPGLLYYSGMAYSLLDRQDEAKNLYEKALSLATEQEQKSNILCSIGDMYYKTEMLDSAFVYYEKAIEVNPYNLLALNNYSYYLAVKGIDLDKAEKMSAITIAAEPENANSLDTYAWIFFKKKNYEMARKYIDEALKHSEGEAAELNSHAGDIYFMCGEPEKALEFWEKALKLDPNDELLRKKVKHKTFFYE